MAGKAEGEKELELTKARLKTLEVELEGFKEAASAESREKADVITAEKKARAQVC